MDHIRALCLDLNAKTIIMCKRLAPASSMYCCYCRLCRLFISLYWVRMFIFIRFYWNFVGRSDCPDIALPYQPEKNTSNRITILFFFVFVCVSLNVLADNANRFSCTHFSMRRFWAINSFVILMPFSHFATTATITETVFTPNSIEPWPILSISALFPKCIFASIIIIIICWINTSICVTSRCVPCSMASCPSIPVLRTECTEQEKNCWKSMTTPTEFRVIVELFRWHFPHTEKEIVFATFLLHNFRLLSTWQGNYLFINLSTAKNPHANKQTNRVNARKIYIFWIVRKKRNETESVEGFSR